MPWFFFLPLSFARFLHVFLSLPVLVIPVCSSLSEPFFFFLGIGIVVSRPWASFSLFLSTSWAFSQPSWGRWRDGEVTGFCVLSFFLAFLPLPSLRVVCVSPSSRVWACFLSRQCAHSETLPCPSSFTLPCSPSTAPVALAFGRCRATAVLRPLSCSRCCAAAVVQPLSCGRCCAKRAAALS